jgi:SAM-dependent methyltransferase
MLALAGTQQERRLMSHSGAVFGGRIPELYDRLMGPLFFEPYAAEAARRLAWLRRGALLETAAGTGIVTVAVAKALPAEVAITATDLAPPMLDAAAAKLPPGRVTFRQADAQRLPFEDAAFDALLCQFGMMFLPDKATGYAEALRVLKPGGRLLFSVWSEFDRNPVPAVVQATVAARYPSDPPTFMARIPHGYSDIPAMSAALERAGFDAVSAERVELPCRAPSARHAATAICQGTPLRNEIEAKAGPGLEAVTAAAVEAVARDLAGGAADTPFEVPMEAIFVSAARPG